MFLCLFLATQLKFTKDSPTVMLMLLGGAEIHPNRLHGLKGKIVSLLLFYFSFIKTWSVPPSSMVAPSFIIGAPSPVSVRPLREKR